MAKTYYSDYINHCLRFYARYPNPVFNTKIDIVNWNTCDEVMKSLPEETKEMLLKIYTSDGNISQTVNTVSEKYGIRIDALWKKVEDLEREVAVRRGLL